MRFQLYLTLPFIGLKNRYYAQLRTSNMRFKKNNTNFLILEKCDKHLFLMNRY